MNGDSDAMRDLLGDPWTPPRDPRGRKRHRVFPQTREIVAQMAATGAKDEEIALQLGIHVDTLKKYYSRELANGLSLIRNVVLTGLYEKAKGGNVAAAKALLDEIEKRGRANEAAYRPRAEAPAPRPTKLGKKEERQAAAERVGGMFAPGPPPRLNS